MNVVLADIQAQLLTSTEADVRAVGADALFVPTDVSQNADMENLARVSYERFGAVDLLVNNAGASQPATVLDESVDDWNWLMDVNFFGML
jgi:NADP-dependent 3-hydroxy acid dehydrogenase YdfG